MKKNIFGNPTYKHLNGFLWALCLSDILDVLRMRGKARKTFKVVNPGVASPVIPQLFP
jgi:hypothetical protein